MALLLLLLLPLSLLLLLPLLLLVLLLVMFNGRHRYEKKDLAFSSDKKGKKNGAKEERKSEK